MSSLLFGVGKKIPYFKLKLAERVLDNADISGGYRQHSHTCGSLYILMILICVSESSPSGLLVLFYSSLSLPSKINNNTVVLRALTPKLYLLVTEK